MKLNYTKSYEPDTSVWGVSLGITEHEVSLTFEYGERYLRLWVDRHA